MTLRHTTKNPYSPILLLTAIVAIASAPMASKADGFKFYGQSAFSIGGFSFGSSSEVEPAFAEIGKNVYAIDNLADQLSYRTKKELSKAENSTDADALVAQVKRHGELTNKLIKAYKSKSKTDLQSVARDVRTSTESLSRLSRDIDLSSTLVNLINQSTPLAREVENQARN